MEQTRLRGRRMGAWGAPGKATWFPTLTRAARR